MDWQEEYEKDHDLQRAIGIIVSNIINCTNGQKRNLCCIEIELLCHLYAKKETDELIEMVKEKMWPLLQPIKLIDHMKWYEKDIFAWLKRK